MKKILVCLLTFFICIMGTSAKIKFATLEKCTDGDTAAFIVADPEKDTEETLKVRFLAVNTPELKTDDYGVEASVYTCNILTNAEEILLEMDDKATTDKYGRTLAWIWVDEELLQAKLVQDGYAEVAYIYGKYKYTDSLCLLQQDAIEDKLNIWSGNRKEGYCSQVDTTNVTNNIKYDDVVNDLLGEDGLKILESGKELEDTLGKIGSKAEKISDSIADNEDSISSVALIIFLAMGGLYLLLKEVNVFKGTSNTKKK